MKLWLLCGLVLLAIPAVAYVNATPVVIVVGGIGLVAMAVEHHRCEARLRTVSHLGKASHE